MNGGGILKLRGHDTSYNVRYAVLLMISADPFEQISHFQRGSDDTFAIHRFHSIRQVETDLESREVPGLAGHSRFLKQEIGILAGIFWGGYRGLHWSTCTTTFLLAAKGCGDRSFAAIQRRAIAFCKFILPIGNLHHHINVAIVARFFSGVSTDHNKFHIC